MLKRCLPGLMALLVLLCWCCPPVLAQRHTAVPKAAELSYLADSTLLNRSDYLIALEKVFETVNQVKVTTGGFYKLAPIASHLEQDETAIALLKERLSQNSRTLNLQNLQMYQTLLEELGRRNQECLTDLQAYEHSLNGVKTQILSLRQDTVLYKVFHTDSLRLIFKDQLTELRHKRGMMDSLIRSNTGQINSLQARTSANILNIKELKYITDSQLRSVGINAFGKERRYLWEPVNAPANGSLGFKRFLQSEQQISAYYFLYTRSSRLLLLLISAVFFGWISYNFRSIRRRNKMAALEPFGFTLIRPRPYQITLIFLLCLAPVFDLQAPALYIESVQVLLALLLTALFYKRMPRKVFYRWCFFVLLLIAPVALRILGLPPRFQRWMLLLFSLLSVAYGLITYRQLKAKAGRYRLLVTVGIIYILFNLLAVACNLFGRFTLTQILYSTALTGCLHAVALIIFARMITEAFLLQIKSSRVRKKYPEHFDWQPIVKNIQWLLSIVVFLIWLSIFLVNLNIFNELYDFTLSILTEKRKIGTLTFTFGGIVLFLLIIWAANFLQKYIAYFFGDTGDDALDENKGERSKLIITRLILLIGGFMLAVAASGLPIDKITVVLGALGVGIGLGLQNIVSNFVSGIILIFDKTLRIGDVVELSDKKGRVKEIGIRASTLLTDDGAEIIIPNGAILSNNIINWTLTNNQMRVAIDFAINKPFDREGIIAMIKETISESENIFTNKEPKVFISPKNKTSSNVKIYFWCKDMSHAESTRSAISAVIFEQLEEQGIEIL